MAILAFHKIGKPSDPLWTTWNYVPEATFASQLRSLRDLGWTVIDADKFVAGLSDPGVLPRRAALLTFDDAYRSMRYVALPWLRRFGYPAVLFVPTGFVGQANAFDEGIEPTEPICSWSDLRFLGRHGVAVQSHGISHRPFSNLGTAKTWHELVRSKLELERRLGKAVKLFAYPYGDTGLAPFLLPRAGYRAAFLYGGKPIQKIGDLFRLERLAIGPDSNLEEMLKP